MAKRRPIPKRPPPSGGTVAVAVAVKTAVAVALVVLLVGGLGYLGRQAGDSLADTERERYAVRVADIQVELPPFLNRADFLTEVRFQSELPETVQAIDPKLPDTLRTAFAKHPWVAEVTGVSVSPEKVIRVEVALRKPALAVTLKDASVRAVDTAGILLPMAAKTDGLPVLANVHLDAVMTGYPFPTPDVKRAAELTTQYPTRTIERTKEGWRLTAPNGNVRVIVTQ